MSTVVGSHFPENCSDPGASSPLQPKRCISHGSNSLFMTRGKFAARNGSWPHSSLLMSDIVSAFCTSWELAIPQWGASWKTFEVILASSTYRVLIYNKITTVLELRQADRMKGTLSVCTHEGIKINSPQNWGNPALKTRFAEKTQATLKL